MLPSSGITMPALNVASPAALPSIVKKVVSAPPSVPLRIISVSSPCASIVILPALVARVTAASPVPISSAALDTLTKDNTPLPFVPNACPLLPSEDGIVNVVPPDVNFKFEPSDETASFES